MNEMSAFMRQNKIVDDNQFTRGILVLLMSFMAFNVWVWWAWDSHAADDRMALCHDSLSAFVMSTELSHKNLVTGTKWQDEAHQRL